MNNTVYIAGTNQPDIFHVGMTENNRDPEDRWKDSDYRAKMIYVPYKVAAFYTGNLRDEPVSKYILKDKNISLLKDEIDIIIDGYSGSEKSSSTIVHCITEPFRIIRKGPISLKELNLICRVNK